MADKPSSKPSFSPGRKFGIGFSVTVLIGAVLAVVVMLNYLSGQIFRRWHLSSQTRLELSSRTTSLLHSLTNQVQITVYCSKEEDYFSDVAALLKEYTSANPKMSVRYIDFDRDPGAAEEFKIKHNLAGVTNRNLITFDCEGRTKIVPGDAIIQTELKFEQGEKSEERVVRKKPVAFLGEMWFTSALIAVTSPKPLKACFLEGHGEHSVQKTADPMGYAEFADSLRQNYIQIEKLTLLGTNTVPDDCNMLVIAGPKDQIPAAEVNRIEKYLNDGGRLLVLFNVLSVERVIGLENLLAKWGVNVTTNIVKDRDFSSSPEGVDVQAFNFRVKHPLVNSLLGRPLQFILPREIDAVDLSSQPDSGLKAEEIVFSGPNAILSNGGMMQRPGTKPLVVAVEKSAAKGVAAERGATRIVVTGDSLFLDNERIKSAANRDFASNLANWLLERPVLLEGVTPKSLTEYRLLITNLQLQTLRWILLAAIPGGVLLLGGLVWLRRRK